MEQLLAQSSPEIRLVFGVLQRQNEQQRLQNQAQREQIQELLAQVEKLQRLIFGTSSEKMPSMGKVLDDEEFEASPEGQACSPKDEEEKQKARKKHSRKKSETKRKSNRDARKKLPVLEIVVRVQDDQIPQGCSRDDFRELGQGTTVDRIEHIPSRLVIQRFRLQTLVHKSDPSQILKSSPPMGVSEGCHYGPGAHAHVVVAKCCDSLPLYRIASQLARMNTPIARSTLCAMFHRTAELLFPIYNRLHECVRADPLVHADETPLSVLAKGKCGLGWVWVTLGSSAVTYTFDESRSSRVANKLLGETTGSLVVDGYSGYNQLAESDRQRCACWAHVRRKFFEAKNSNPEAEKALELIQALYRVERDVAYSGKLGSPEHLKLRQTKSRASFEDFFEWISERHPAQPPKSPLGKAMAYAVKYRDALGRFLDDAELPLDNNAAERALRIVAIGRKNFLFAGHTEGAQNLAVLQSIVGTCQIHGVNPYEYISDVLVKSQKPGITIDELLPWNWSPTANRDG